MSFNFFAGAHGTFSRIDHILGHKSSLGKIIEVIPSIFSDHNAVRLDLNYRRITIKNPNIWRLNNTLLNNQQFAEEIKKEIKIWIQFSSVQSLSRVWLFATSWVAALQASLSITISRSSIKLMSTESVMPSSHLILCHTLFLLSTIPPSIRVFSNESTLHMRWPKYWSFSFSIIPSKEHKKWIKIKTQQPQNYGTL